MISRTRPSTRLPLAAAAMLALVSALPAFARPARSQIEPLKEALEKKIKVEFRATPLTRVAETLQEATGLTVVVDPGMGDRSNLPVTLSSASMRVIDVLDLLRDAHELDDIDWDITRGMVVIGHRSRLAKRSVVTRSYVIQSLTAEQPDFWSPSIDAADGVNLAHGREPFSIPSIFESDDGENRLTRAEGVEGVITMIQDTVGRQDEWAAYGGEISSLREYNGQLIVRTTPEQHEQIGKLLQELAKAATTQVATEARWVVLPTATLDKLLGPSRSRVLDAGAADKLLTELANPGAGAKAVGTARTLGFDGQRVWTHSVKHTAFLSDADANAAGVDPVLSLAQRGAILDVQPTANYSRTGVIVTVRSQVATALELTKSTVPAGVKIGNAPATSGEVEIEKPQQDLVTFRTSVRIPDGGAVVLTSGSTGIKATEKGDSEVVLILRARIVDPK